MLFFFLIILNLFHCIVFRYLSKPNKLNFALIGKVSDIVSKDTLGKAIVYVVILVVSAIINDIQTLTFTSKYVVFGFRLIKVNNFVLFLCQRIVDSTFYDLEANV